ncbi:ABC transporter ATP-binding protein [Marinibacterium sp. SX1]|uniref:ABC transporter ATP-binding protein n=1 Tax=Marinibacterium sp. SX1 TaxID=3388424 RepID=UPI003D16FC2C
MAEHALEARGLAAGYAGRRVIEGLDLAIARGRFTALLGPNGCGKSTLLRTIGGQQAPLGGEVRLGGVPMAAIGARARARQVALLAQGAQPPEGLTVEDLVRQGRYPHRRMLRGWSAEDAASVEAALQRTGLTGLRGQMLDRLSGGQRQRAWIAMTLAQQGEILLLDEPTSYLDPAHQLDVLGLVGGLVAGQGVTVLAVLHDLNQAARHADHLVLLKDGRIRHQGPPAGVLTPGHIREVFGIDMRIIEDPETGGPLCVPRRVQPARDETGEGGRP